MREPVGGTAAVVHAVAEADLTTPESRPHGSPPATPARRSRRDPFAAAGASGAGRARSLSLFGHDAAHSAAARAMSRLFRRGARRGRSSGKAPAPGGGGRGWGGG